MYNRASADPAGKPWSERKKLIWWDPAQRRWTGYDTPDFEPDKPPDYQPSPEDKGMSAISGDSPFIQHPDGRGWLFAPGGVKDGPLPTHYEPRESPIRNPLFGVQFNPTLKEHASPLNRLANPTDPAFPIVATTHRLTEHYLSGPMSRFNGWLNELQPEMFIELSPELAELSGIQHGGWVVVSTPRGEIEARAMITARLKPLTVQGHAIHQIGIPIHWGYSGEVVGDCANDLTALVTEANVSMHEAKAFVCNVRAGRLNRQYPAKVKFVQSSTYAVSRVVPESAQPEGRNAGEVRSSTPRDSKTSNRAPRS